MVGKIKKTPKKEKFFQLYAEHAINSCQKFKDENNKVLFPSVLLAQAILESGWGDSGLTKISNNFFGVKTHKWKGESVMYKTREEINGKSVYVMAPFRKYDTPEDSFNDRNNFLKTNPTYTKNGVFDSNNALEQIQALKRAGYATDSKYVDEVYTIIKQNGLEDYDDKIV